MNEKKEITEREKRLDRKFTAIVYPDATDYTGTCEDVLNRVEQWGFPEWAYILHNRDKNPDGTPKKPHYHIVVKKTSPTSLITVSRQLGIPSNYVQPVRNWKNMIKYLVHDEQSEKIQYEIEEITTGDTKLLLSYFKDEDETEQARRILQFLTETDCISYIDLLDWCIKNDLYSACRRNAGLWSNVIREKRGG